MKESEFRKLFYRILGEAIEYAEHTTGLRANRTQIELHGAGFSGRLMSPSEAAELLYINETTFYPIIDVGTKAWERGVWRVFVGVSGYSPTSFEKTWNNPVGNGPFKIIIPYKIKVVE